MKRSRTGILLANTGTPSAPEPAAVKTYLERFLMDKRIRPMPYVPWWLILHCFILPKRKYASAQRYKAIWTSEGSPLDVGQNALASALQSIFDEEGRGRQADDGVVVESAMSYSEPNIGQALRDLATCGCERIVLLPLYPQSAYSTTGSVVDSFDAALKSCDHPIHRCVIENYGDNPSYIAALADSIRSAGFAPHGDDRLLLSFHSIPLKDEHQGDTYRLQTEKTVELVAHELGMSADDVAFGYQCVFGNHPEEWLGPLSEDILETWAKEDFGRVFFATPGFAVECLETLYDIPKEMACIINSSDTIEQGPACKRGLSGEEDPETVSKDAVVRFRTIPCLGTSLAHAHVLRNVVEPYLEKEHHGE
jgi:ferrochelatase